MEQSTSTARRFSVVPERSVVLVSARSNVGPIEFGMSGLEGSVQVAVIDGELDLATTASAELTLPIANLRSGNQLYDAELSRRIDARRYPLALLELATGARSSVSRRYRLEGVLTFHGVRRDVHGAVEAVLDDSGRLIVDGEQVFDTRDFDVPTPSVLMLRIYPDVKVQLHVEAEPAPTSSAS